jgi:hypothetical protein
MYSRMLLNQFAEHFDVAKRSGLRSIKHIFFALNQYAIVLV